MNILTDTGYWLGLIDNRDSYHEKSNEVSSLIEGHRIIIPWPCLYETLSTRLIRQREKIILFEKHMSLSHISLLEDDHYKSNALNQVFIVNNKMGFSHSLTDAVIREMLKDVNTKIDAIVTYNRKDFVDVCLRREIQIID